MFPNSPFARPTSSFNNPVALVAPLPSDSPIVQILVNQSYIPYILGCLQQLLLQSTWNTNDYDQIDIMQQKIWTLIGMVGSATAPYPRATGSAGVDVEDFMIRQDPDNPCLLQSSVDGVSWCTFADLSKCLNPGQPGSSQQPQPPSGGGQHCYDLSWNAAGTALIPTVVNSGDTLTVQSASGAGQGGSPVQWYCTDGQQFFAGGCIGQQFTDSSDPAPSIFHGRLVFRIGSNYYDAAPGTVFTVPSGITNQQVTIQANFPLSGASGSYVASVCVTNNQPASWSHTLDFTLNTWGFSAYTGDDTPGAVWTSGVGWTGAAGTANPGNRYCDIGISVPSTTVVSAIVYYKTNGISGGYDFELFNPSQNAFALPNSGGSQIAMFNPALSSVTIIRVLLEQAGSQTEIGVTRLIISGTGTDPFPFAP